MGTKTAQTKARERFARVAEEVRSSYDLNPFCSYQCPKGEKPSDVFKHREGPDDVEQAMVAQMCIFGAHVVWEYKSIPSGVLKRCYMSFSPVQRFNLLTQVIHYGDSFWLSIAPYDEFLQTVYWKIMRDYMLYHLPDCQLCKCTKHLHVHHKTYEWRGWEWTAPFDNLITLCADCHGKFHDKRREP